MHVPYFYGIICFTIISCNILIISVLARTLVGKPSGSLAGVKPCYRGRVGEKLCLGLTEENPCLWRNGRGLKHFCRAGEINVCEIWFELHLEPVSATALEAVGGKPVIPDLTGDPLYVCGYGRCR